VAVGFECLLVMLSGLGCVMFSQAQGKVRYLSLSVLVFSLPSLSIRASKEMTMALHVDSEYHEPPPTTTAQVVFHQPDCAEDDQGEISSARCWLRERRGGWTNRPTSPRNCLDNPPPQPF
jgi:hypothetical protein